MLKISAISSSLRDIIGQVMLTSKAAGRYVTEVHVIVPYRGGSTTGSGFH